MNPAAAIASGLHRQRGFTLLEAIVALAIIGIALIPVLSFLSQSSRQLVAVADSNRRASAQQTAMAFVETINPRLMPSGEAVLTDSLTLRWVSRPLTDLDSPGVLGGRLGGSQLAFFALDVTVVSNNEDWFTFEARKVGYEPRSLNITGTIP